MRYVVFAVVLFLLNALDAAASYWLFKTGWTSEFNPFLRWAWTSGPAFFVAIKMCLAALSSGLIYRFRLTFPFYVGLVVTLVTLGIEASMIGVCLERAA